MKKLLLLPLVALFATTASANPIQYDNLAACQADVDRLYDKVEYTQEDAATLNDKYLAAMDDVNQLVNTIEQARIELQIAHDKIYTYINQPYGEKDYDLILDATLEIQDILNDLGGHVDPGTPQSQLNRWQLPSQLLF